MNSGMIWTLLLGLIVLSLFTAVLMPALMELYRPRDNQPLKVLREFDGNIANFAIGFGRFIESELGDVLASFGSGPFIRDGNLSSGEPYLFIGNGAKLPSSSKAGEGNVLERIVVSAGAADFPDDAVFTREVYAENDLNCGARTIFRAVLSNGRISLGSDSAVLRWMHAKGNISVASGSQIMGRTSSDSGISLSENVTFERLNAPRIEFGERFHASLDLKQLAEWEPDGKARRVGSHWMIKGNVSIPSQHGCQEALVTEGTLDVGSGSWMRAAIKGKKDLKLGAGCRCDDAVIAGNALEIGEDCQLTGPLISESSIVLKRGSIVGTEDHPTTVTAPRISIEPGVVVFGSIWARELGKVEEPA